MEHHLKAGALPIALSLLCSNLQNQQEAKRAVRSADGHLGKTSELLQIANLQKML